MQIISSNGFQTDNTTKCYWINIRWVTHDWVGVKISFCIGYVDCEWFKDEEEGKFLKGEEEEAEDEGGKEFESRDVESKDVDGREVDGREREGKGAVVVGKETIVAEAKDSENTDL